MLVFSRDLRRKKSGKNAPWASRARWRSCRWSSLRAGLARHRTRCLNKLCGLGGYGPLRWRARLSTPRPAWATQTKGLDTFPRWASEYRGRPAVYSDTLTATYTGVTNTPRRKDSARGLSRAPRTPLHWRVRPRPATARYQRHGCDGGNADIGTVGRLRRKPRHEGTRPRSAWVPASRGCRLLAAT